MRANSPVDDFRVLEPPQEESPESKLTPEHKQLAKLGKSAEWKLIKDYLDTRVNLYKNTLFGQDLSEMPAAEIGNRFLAAQTVVYEFEALIKEVEQTVQIVDDAIQAGRG